MMRTILINGEEKCLSEIPEVFTHGGKFHADEVCATALIEFFGFKGDVNRIFKVSDELKESDALIYDIGNTEFDHHDKEAMEYYPDGCPMSAFGKIARAIRIDGKTIEELFPGFTDEIAKPIEAHDNGYSSDTIAESYFAKITNSYFPTWEEESDPKHIDAAFREAVDVCRDILRRQLIHLRSREVAKLEVATAERIDGVLIFEKYLPWGDYIQDIPEIKGAIYPSIRGGWNLQVAPDKSKPGVTANRAVLEFTPEQEALCSFIHPAKFICAVDDKETAIKLIPGVKLI